MRALLFTIVFALALAGSTALADTSSSSDSKDYKKYGNCHVITQVDLFTDKEWFIFGCVENSLTDMTAIGLVKHPGEPLIVTLNKGLMFHLDPTIPVAIRIDKGPLRELEAHWVTEGHKAVLIDRPSLALTLLEELAQGQRAVIKVGKESGNVRLNGSSKAIQDFKRRAGLIYQQTLTPAQRQR